VAELLGGEGSVGYWVVVVFGNILIVLVEGLIVGIQTMRLHYYEFFSKFFAGGGMAFDPLKPLTSPVKSQAGAAL
jgi:V/A-type H+-transporting ATPase subunit I